MGVYCAAFAQFFERHFSTLEPMASNPFTTHPHESGETYREHMGVAFGVSRQLAGAAAAALVHGLVPSLCTTTASDRIRALNACLERRDRDGLRKRARFVAVDGAA